MHDERALSTFREEYEQTIVGGLVQVQADKEHVVRVFEGVREIRLEVCFVLLHIIGYEPVSLAFRTEVHYFRACIILRDPA
jgi:hypothetical protein